MRVLRHLRRHGWFDDTIDESDPIADEAPALAAFYGGSIARRQTRGLRQGAPLMQIGAESDKRWVERPLGPLQRHMEGFDVHARLAIATDQACCGGSTCAPCSGHRHSRREMLPSALGLRQILETSASRSIVKNVPSSTRLT
jgi:hypothetical protein